MKLSSYEVECLEKEMCDAYDEAHETINGIYDDWYKENPDTMMPYDELQKRTKGVYNKYNELNRKFRLHTPFKMSPIPNYGDHMTLEDFKEACESWCFIDDDGHGYYASETEESSIPICPSDFDSDCVRDDFTHVVWYNK